MSAPDISPEAIERWLRGEADAVDEFVDAHPDGEIVDVDSRSITVFDVGDRHNEAARYRAAADLVRDARSPELTHWQRLAVAIQVMEDHDMLEAADVLRANMKLVTFERKTAQ